jgi:DNA polymerase-1
MGEKKKILVIDGNSIINRAFYGIRFLSTKSGQPTNAIYGMINIISKQMDAINPDYAAVAFDLKAPTFRHKLYPEYKAGRHPTPDELKVQFAPAKECLSLMGISVLELEGYEADDIQGTIANFAHGCPFDAESYVLSGDRDLLQLIDDRVSVLLATNTDTLLMDREAFREKYGIESSQFIDLKALMGDSSDNIPGVAGVGEKTACQLIQNFGTLEGIYENIDDERIKKGVREKLIQGKDSAYLSRELATINKSVPIISSLEDIKRKEIQKDELYNKFKELELFSFITKFGLSEPKEEKTERTNAEFEVIVDADNADFLHTGGDTVAIYPDSEALYIATSNGSYKFIGELSDLAGTFEQKRVICFNAKELYHRFMNACVSLKNAVLCDLSLYAYVINPAYVPKKIEQLISEHLNLDVLTPSPSLLFSLEDKMMQKVKQAGGERILCELELPLISVLADMEIAGFKIDCKGMLDFARELDILAEELAKRVYMRAGHEFNLNSPKQLGEVLFVELMLPYEKKKTKTGYSTDAETLEGLRAYSPIIEDILEYRQVTKLRSTYAAVFPDLADENDRIHTDFKQALTATGRLSSAEPNLQNIPIRTKMGRAMRKFFIPKEGCVLIDADYSQIELRLLAEISGDYSMREAFCRGDDIHKKTASAVFHVPESEVSSDMRKKAKAVNFGIIYGISGFSLSKDIGTTPREANAYIKSYMLSYPEVSLYLERVVKDATEKGYTKTPMGRRRYIPELSASNGITRAFGKRVAMNAPIQGAAADIMKLSMINVDRAIRREGLSARIVMQVHDELIVECKESDRAACEQLIKREMENAVKLNVPLTVDISSGYTWLDAH